MKTSKIALLVILPMIAASVVVSACFLYSDYQCKNAPIDLTISTIGDSLTDAGHYGTDIRCGAEILDCYQYYTYKYLKNQDLNTIVHNLGISGQTISQICSRLNATVPANYTVCMGGTNDVWRANYSLPGINDTLANRIIGKYNDTIFNTISYQQDLGYTRPVFVICSIPPFGKVTPPVYYDPHIINTIKHVNAALKTYIQGFNDPYILFCDVYEAMSTDDGYMIDGLCYADGVHFTVAGNQVMGETVARTIWSHHSS
nr:GDSL-type esterase/lipase family protein [Candidatus Sigynarchaeum springense]